VGIFVCRRSALFLSFGFEGITQANPVGPALFKGWWQKKNRKTIVIGHLTYVFGLAKIHESEEAKSVVPPVCMSCRPVPFDDKNCLVVDAILFSNLSAAVVFF
jgi:hypothetical protein